MKCFDEKLGLTLNEKELITNLCALHKLEINHSYLLAS